MHVPEAEGGAEPDSVQSAPELAGPFREDAVRYAYSGAKHLHSTPIYINPPRTAVWVGLLLAVLLVLACIFLATAAYSRSEEVAGWVVPEGGLVRVAARSSGILNSIYVREGSTVHAGDALALLRLSADVPQGDVGAALLDQLAAEGAANESRAAALLAAIDSQEKALRTKRAILTTQLEEVRRRIDLAEQERSASEASHSRAEALFAKGFLSAASMDGARRGVLAADAKVREARGDMLQVEERLEDIRSNLEQLPGQRAAAHAEADGVSSALVQRRLLSESQAKVIVRSPLSGVVAAVPFRQGETITADSSIAVIGGGGADLYAELYAPSRAAGFIRSGQEVQIKLDAFPFEKFGKIEGRIVEISHTILGPSEYKAPGANTTGAAFRIRAKLSQNSINAYGEKVRILPGMSVKGVVILDRRSLFEWIVDPLYAAEGR